MPALNPKDSADPGMEIKSLRAENERLWEDIKYYRECFEAIDRIATAHERGGINKAQRIARGALSRTIG